MIRGIGASVAVAVAAIAYFMLSRKGLHCTYCALKIFFVLFSELGYFGLLYRKGK